MRDTAVPTRAFAFAFSAGVETNIEIRKCNYEYILNQEYFKCAGQYGVTTFPQEKICKIAAKKVADRLFQLEPMLENISEDDIVTLQFKEKRVSASNNDSRTFQIESCKGIDIGFNFNREIDAVIIPQIASYNRKTGEYNVTDIAANWFGVADHDVSFIKAVTRMMRETNLDGTKDWGRAFGNSGEKFQNVYRPVLDTLAIEIDRICEHHSSAPAKLISRFFGDKDYYKVLLADDGKSVTLQAYNPYKTMSNDVSGEFKFPTRLISAGYKMSGTGRKSETTLTLLFDEGWQLNMGLRSTGEKAKVSNIRFKVDFKGSRPYGVYEEIINL